MKAAVMSDIHGNHIALEKSLEYALEERVDVFIFLGDYLGEFPYPQRTMDMIYTLRDMFKCYFIRGNKEDYWINCRDEVNCDWKNGNKGVGAMKYCYERLSPEDICFFEQMPISQVIQFSGYEPVMVCHGSPYSNRKEIHPDDPESRKIIGEVKEKWILCGHTHFQEMFAFGEKKVINPGSVGVALHGGGRAQFTILEGTESGWKPEFISIPYDIERELEEIHTSGLYEYAPYWCRITEHLLRGGEVSHGAVLNEVMRLNGFKDPWYNIADCYWEEAIGRMFGFRRQLIGIEG